MKFRKMTAGLFFSFEGCALHRNAGLFLPGDFLNLFVFCADFLKGKV